MGSTYQLVNFTKQERLAFHHLPGKARELAGEAGSAAVVTWYMLENRGDHIAFVQNEELQGYGRWSFPAPPAHVMAYPDRTESVIQALVAAGVLRDCGKRHVDQDHPERIYVRDIRNCWQVSGTE